jgi:hypothetical protein
VHTARLARAYALVGEVEHAAAVGSQALGLGAGTASALVVTELRKLDAWRGVPAIASLTAELESAAPESAAVESAASGAETA